MKKILFLLTILCVSCTNKVGKEEEILEFPLTGSLTAQIAPVPTPILLPRHIGATDDYLFVYKEREEKLFAFLALKTVAIFKMREIGDKDRMNLTC